jgi:hypothetical protein
VLDARFWLAVLFLVGTRMFHGVSVPDSSGMGGGSEEAGEGVDVG